MLKRGVFLFLVILAGCSNPPAPKEINPVSHAKSKGRTVKTAANPWTISSFAPKEGETEGTKFVRIVTKGDFSDSTQTSNYLYAEVLFDKKDAGIFLRKLKKSNPVEIISGTVQIKMTNSSGQELQMTSSRNWNSSGGIKIERNNNNYSQFRIFLLQSTGNVSVEIKDSGFNTYNLTIDTYGFSDSFSKL